MSTSFRLPSVLGLAVLVCAGAAWAADPPDAAATAFSGCSECHDTVAAAFASNPHARTATKPGDKAICESCHGDGAAHAAEGDAALIKVPKGSAGAGTCLSCHQGGLDYSVSGRGAHATARVYCGECHAVHNQDPTTPALLRTRGSEPCMSCHPDAAHQFDRPYAHKLGDNAMTCASCHDPHGGRGEKSVKQTRAGELVCVGCHTDKRGPFVYPHVNDVAGDCMTCHQPHGSVNEKRLIRSRVDQLCLECHTGTTGTLGSQPPSLHDMRSPRYQNCTTCHTAVHGSNSSPLLLK
jgi:DmsE family decaheme c-type cytochrome